MEFNKQLSDVKYRPRQPFSSIDYRPEMDTSSECNDQQIAYYQNLIGVLRWIVELGRIDIAFEVALLSKFLALPRTGHLAQALRVFKYLDCHKTNEIAMDPAYHVIMDEEEMEQKINEMKQLYVDSKEEIHLNVPDPRGSVKKNDKSTSRL